MILAALIVLALPQAAVRARMAEKDEAERRAVETITFPGFDAGDTSVIASAEHFCGKTDECRSSFLSARTDFIRSAAIEGKQKQALKILTSNADGAFTDWRFANTLYQAKYHPPARPDYGLTTSCYTYIGKSFVSTTCHSY